MVVTRPVAPFVGRAAELERLRQLTDGAASGSAAAVLISGDAGVGKTSLIAEASHRAAERGLLILLGRCVDLGTGALPYLPFAEAFSQLVRAGETDEAAGAGEPAVRAAAIVRQVAGERPSLGRIAGRPEATAAQRAPGEAGLDRLALFEAVAHLLARIGDEVAPVLLVIEDLHWADPSTRDLVRFLLARLAGDRLLVVVSYRGDDLHRRHPLRPLLGELLRLPQVQRLELLPFGTDELADFLHALYGDPVPDELLTSIGRRSAGNAHYAEELLAAGAQDRLPTGLADVLLDRLERLSAAGQRMVRMASVLGAARIQDGLLRAAVATLDGGAADTDEALREALAHQLLVADGSDLYAFRHALLQEAVYTDLLPGERVRMHAAAAAVLSGPDYLATAAATEASATATGATATAGAGDRDAGDLARHSLAAHDLPLALAASLRAASAASSSSAPAEALGHYEEALQLWDAVDPQRRPAGRDLVAISVAAAAAADDAGLYDRAVHLSAAALTEALATSDPGGPQVARARAALALHDLAIDQDLAARDQARQVIAELTDPAPSPDRALARSIEARVDLALGDAESALALLPAALTEAGQLGLLGLQVELLTTRAVAAGMAGQPGVAGYWAAARAAAEQAGDRPAMVRVLYNASIDQFDGGDLPGALATLAEALIVADASGLASSRYGALCRSLLTTIRWQAGDAEGALAVVRPAAGLPNGSTTLSRHLRLYELPVLALRDPEQVLLAEHWLVVGDASFDNQVLHTARAEAFTWLGRPWESVAEARTALDLVDGTAEPYPLVGISISTTALAALADEAARARAGGEADAEQRAVEAGQAFAEDGRTRGRCGKPRRFTMGPEGLAWLARLSAESARLRAADTVADWDAVIQAFDGVSVFELARARWRQAEALIRAGRREPARVAVQAARATALTLGTAPLLAVLDDLAHRARFEPPRPDQDDVLTRREREVMALVADGLTNRAIGERLFISEKTASVHVSNVLTKLNASGRAEAVAILGRRGLLD